MGSPTPAEYSVVPVDEVWQQSPSEATPRRKRTFSDRGLKLVEVSLEALDKDCRSPDVRDACKSPSSDLACANRPKRLRMAPVEAWRGERVILHRPPGSPCPEIKGAVLNDTQSSSGLQRSPMVARALKD